ncbi:MAG: cache domain-containing protein [Deltaproteobacteria bacterium]|nr:cache domain-containing protein [Deltaproteobacteria bacterium]
MRKRLFLGLGLCLVVTLFFSLALAQDKATKDECVAKCKEAAKLIKEKGLDAALKVLNDPKGPFVWKDSYIFTINIDTGLTLSHLNPKMIGKNLVEVKDVNGKLFYAEYIEVAKNKGEGWVNYMWPKPNEKTPSKKLTYIYRVPGEPIALGAGIYEN